MIRIVAKRYAKALVELSEEKNTVDKTKADLAAFVGAVDSQPALQRHSASPRARSFQTMTMAMQRASPIRIRPIMYSG